MSSNKLPVGLHFNPTDVELVNHYLKRKITGEIQSEMELIPDVNVYNYDPWDLLDKPGDTGYFFTSRGKKYPGSRVNRSTKGGYWRPTGKDGSIISVGPTGKENIIGMKKALVFYKGLAPRGMKTNWAMYEYRTAEPEFESRNKGDYVVCKLFRKFSKRVRDQTKTDHNIREQLESKHELSLWQKDLLTFPGCSLPSHGAQHQSDDTELPEGIIYGREEDKRRIVELVLSNNHQNRDINFICIVSDRGIGKTTMLCLIYHNERVCGSFDTRLFISMPEKFDEKMLLRMIIESLTCASCDASELETLEEIVEEELTGKKLLLVLDNFENKDQRFCNFPLVLLNVSLKGSVILVSTRSEAVSYIRAPVKYYYYLNNLSDHFCWMICYQHTFGRYSKPEPKLVNIGEHLVAKCGNITSCVTVLSGLLRQSIIEEWWKTVLESNLWEMDEMGGDILPVLRVCYEFLPPHLKTCFKYCSLYPKNYLFRKHNLVLMWLSQGFIEPREGRELEEIGLEYFDELLSRSFFQHSPFHETEDKFLMPNLIHDLAQVVSINECFRSDGCVHSVPENACHLSLVPHEYQSISLKDLTREAQNLHTFMVVNRSALQQESISSPVVNLVDLDYLFTKCVSLATLELSNSDIEELPNSIGLLKNLHYMGLNNTKIKCIPSEISSLINLETIEAKNCHYLEELPGNIQALNNLRHLDVTRESGYNIVMPCGIGKLTNLQTLSIFNVGKGQSYCRIEELKNINFLKGKLMIFGLENVESGINAKEADFARKIYLESLSLHWSDIIMIDEGVMIAEELIQNLQPFNNLSELIIRNYPGNTFPTWLEYSPFPNLASIILDNCYNLEKLPILGKLPLLKYLSIVKLYAVQKINLSNGFPSLEILNIWEMYELEEWVEIEDGDFPRLHTLSINRCPFLRNIPRFQSIIELSIYNCAQLPEIIELLSLEYLKIEGFMKIKSINLPENLPRLRKLEVSQCPELLSIEGLSNWFFIENVKISGCPKLDMSKNQCSIHLNEKIDISVLTQGEEIDLNEQMSSNLSDDFNLHDDHEVVSNKRKASDDVSFAS